MSSSFGGFSGGLGGSSGGSSGGLGGSSGGSSGGLGGSLGGSSDLLSDDAGDVFLTFLILSILACKMLTVSASFASFIALLTSRALARAAASFSSWSGVITRLGAIYI